MAKLLSQNGVGVLSTFISPYAEDRKNIRDEVTNYIEVFVDTPLEVCEERDVKGLYKKAREGVIKEFTGISDPYESPQNPEIMLHTDVSVEENCALITEYLIDHGFLEQ